MPLVCTLMISCQMQKDEAIRNAVPSLDEVSGIWVSADSVDMEPSIRNFRGTALLNRDLTSLSWFVSAPYSGGYHTGVMRINGKTPRVSKFRWLPHQAIRHGEMDGLRIYSTVKMVPEEDAIMWEITLANDSAETDVVDISLDMIGFISKYGGHWQWWYPYPKMDGATTVRDDEVENVRKHIGEERNFSTEEVVELINGKPTPADRIARWPSDGEILAAEKYSADLDEGFLMVSDSETGAITGFSLLSPPDTIEVKRAGGTARWKVSIGPGGSYTLSYLMAYGDDKQRLKESMAHWTENFNPVFQGVSSVWEERWMSLFSPDSSLISGCFPVLETDDRLARKVYYTGPLTMLYLMNTNLPQHDMVYLTGGPRWGASITFFWDITEWATLWAVTHPSMMKEQLSAWILIDPSKYYGKDNFGGEGVGNGYSANYWALFQMIRAYVTITRDTGFLDQVISGKRVIDHLESYALNWRKLAPYGKPGYEEEIYQLADFGDDEWNLLECVPTYKHIVPSFNAGYIWMMRELADMVEMKGDGEKASGLRKEADEMVERLMKLYAGEGVWYSLYPGGKKIEVRHCLDFMFMGRYLPGDLTGQVKQEMLEFLYDELITDRWMRAQSLRDVAAAESDRPDHGPLGAFDGWPAGTMDALSRMGYPEKALDFYHAIEPVTYEGCWAQAHELWGDHKYEKNARVRIAQRGWHNRESSGGISLSQVMLKNFFGFYPGMEGGPITGSPPPDFSGRLHHVLYGGTYYTLTARDGKIKMKKER